MKLLFHIFRTLIVSLLVLLIMAPVALYALLPLPAVQEMAARTAREQLTLLLGTEVEIGSVELAPFNRVVVDSVTVLDPSGHPALRIGHLGAGISLVESIVNKKWAISYAEILDLDLHLYRDSAGAPLNIEPIIERFKKKPSGAPTKFSLSVNTVVIRRSRVSYDVLSEPLPDQGVFSKSHIALADVCADLNCHTATESHIEASLRRLSATDRSGLTLSNVSFDTSIDTVGMRIEGFKAAMPHSRILLGDIHLPSPLGGKFNTDSISTPLSIEAGSYVSTVDLRPLAPVLREIDRKVELSLEANINSGRLDLSRFAVDSDGRELAVKTSGRVTDLFGHDPELTFDDLDISADVPQVAATLASTGNPAMVGLSEKLTPLLPLGDVGLAGRLLLRKDYADFDGSITTALGDIDLEGKATFREDGSVATEGSFETVDFTPTPLAERLEPLSSLTSDGSFHLLVKPRAIPATYEHPAMPGLYGDIHIAIREAQWLEFHYREIGAEVNFSGEHIEAVIDSHVPTLSFTLEASTDLFSPNALTQIHADIRHIAVAPFITGPYANLNISGEFETNFSGAHYNEINGELTTKELSLTLPDRHLYISRLDAEMTADETYHSFHLTSDPLDLHLTGHYTYDGLVRALRNALAETLPAVITPSPLSAETSKALSARLQARFKPDTTLTTFFKIPVQIIDTVGIYGSFTPFKSNLTIGAPYLAQKNKIIEQTRVKASVTPGATGISVATTMPSKKGPVSLNLSSDARYNTVGTVLNWKIGSGKGRYLGSVDVGTRFIRDSLTRALTTTLNINPSDLIINDTIWNLAPSRIDVVNREIAVDGFSISRPGERLGISGIASADSLQTLVVDLRNINLDYIFSTLDLGPNVNFGGIASGKINAKGVLSHQPYLQIPTLQVKNFSYNNCVMGDAAIRSWWDNEEKAIYLSADVENHNGGRALVAGFINPVTQALDLRFDARRAPVGFLQTFMSAFASEVSGSASGILRLFGTFSNVDLEGDVYADDFTLRIGFTNVAYHVSDSVKIRPGRIDLANVKLRDSYNNRALLSGSLTHNCFHDPVFDFNITDANRLLLYDISRRQSVDPWYGKVFGSGRAGIKGWPGMVEIGVNVSTTAGSRFTLVLDDREEASDYAFITLRDRDAARKDSLKALADTIPLSVKEMRKRLDRRYAEQPTDYSMNFDINITPEAALTLIMDPSARDSISASGRGEMKMAYSSTGDLSLRGDYSIDHGTYIFTMQDVIEKKFNIRNGSKVTFNGNPYAARLDITAAYPVKANLSDLDESFLHDGELQNTNINFNALLKVTGDMRAPDIKFDLEFPNSVTSDLDRKVRSIISTDEMMERQMIYLLALNRFYTPDYMNGTHGNELVSVASSTISSRLSSMLGQLSDNWSIAPAFRSSKGDFSDVEVDLGLSSHLLNNRLLLNGNLGYRDKALNNNSFIGDFDVRYLLNRAGSIQLKAYNRYNDQNYYLKSALTTQGIGVMFRRDFDNWLTFFRRRKKPAKEKNNADSGEPAAATESAPTKTENDDSED